MKKEENNLDRLKGTNPFTVPEGYMEGLTERIMSQLPEKPEERAKRISLMDQMCIRDSTNTVCSVSSV